MDGFQKTGPGATVEPVEWTDPSQAQPAGADPAAANEGAAQTQTPTEAAPQGDAAPAAQTAE